VKCILKSAKYQNDRYETKAIQKYGEMIQLYNMKIELEKLETRKDDKIREQVYMVLFMLAL